MALKTSQMHGENKKKIRDNWDDIFDIFDKKYQIILGKSGINAAKAGKNLRKTMLKLSEDEKNEK